MRGDRTTAQGLCVQCTVLYCTALYRTTQSLVLRVERDATRRDERRGERVDWTSLFRIPRNSLYSDCALLWVLYMYYHSLLSLSVACRNVPTESWEKTRSSKYSHSSFRLEVRFVFSTYCTVLYCIRTLRCITNEKWILPLVSSRLADSNLYAHHVFRSLDSDSTGTLNFEVHAN